MSYLNSLGFDWQNLVAASWFIFAWMMYNRYAEQLSRSRPSLLNVIYELRLYWMREMLKRDNRMMDATMIGNLLRSISFFASTSMLLVLGLLTMMTYRERAEDIITALPFTQESTALLWELKIIVLALIFVYAFFKFTWSLRQYNYACVFVAAAPHPTDHSIDKESYAQKGAQLINNASRHFNYGIRAYYYGMAAFTWFLHPFAFMILTGWVVLVLYRREFMSYTLNSLMNVRIPPNHHLDPGL